MRPGGVVKIGAKIVGNLPERMEAEIGAGAVAVTRGTARAAVYLKEVLRGQVIGSGLGARLSKTWRSEAYPKGGKVSLRAAGLVYSKAPNIVRAFDDGAQIRSRDGFWLAIPTAAAPKKGVGGKRITPSNFPEHRFGPLRFVRGRGRVSYLVVENLRASTGKRKGFRKASKRALKSGQGLTTVIMFLLVQQVSLRKRLDVDGATRQAERHLVRAILTNWRGPLRRG